MKHLMLFAGILGIAISLNAVVVGEETTIKGEALCAKCELKEAKSCQAAIRVKEGDKTTIYYAEQNKVAKDFHKQICADTVKVVATGEVKEVDGKKHITLSKIEKADKS